MKRRLHVDSTDRTSTSSSTSDFSVVLNEPLLEVKGFRLLSASIPNTWYNVTSANNKLDLEDSLLQQGFVTVPPGMYTASELATALSNTSNMSVGFFPSDIPTVTYSDTTGKFTITFPNSLCKILWYNGVNASETIGTLIGFDTSTDINHIQINEANYIGSLYQPSMLGIVLDGLPYTVAGIAGARSRPFHFLVPVTGSRGDITQYNADNTFTNSISFGSYLIQCIREIKVRLLDLTTGLVLDINNADWQMSLEFDVNLY
jgi:hypothetical protein